MEIKAGQIYKTRDNRKVRVYATDGDDTKPIHGAVETKYGWVSWSWTKQGKAYFGEQTFGDDIVELY